MGISTVTLSAGFVRCKSVKYDRNQKRHTTSGCFFSSAVDVCAATERMRERHGASSRSVEIVQFLTNSGVAQAAIRARLLFSLLENASCICITATKGSRIVDSTQPPCIAYF